MDKALKIRSFLMGVAAGIIIIVLVQALFK
jgi:hypothetical protein